MDSILNRSKPAVSQQQFSHQREIFVDQSLVGLIVGTQGSQIKKIQEQFNVTVNVERSAAAGDKRKITVYGKSEKDVEDAIEEIFLEKIVIPIEQQLAESVCSNSNLNYFFEKSHVIDLNVEKNSHNGGIDIVAIGTRRALEDLKFYVQTHINLSGQIM